MALTDKRKGELAVAILKQMSLEEETAMSDSQASHLIEDLAGTCKRLPAELGASYGEIFDLFREIITEANKPVFDRAVWLFGEPVPDSRKKPVDILSQH